MPRPPKVQPASGLTAAEMATVRDVFANVFTKLQLDPEAELLAWARNNPTSFYKLASKLIPAKVEASGGFTVKVVTGVPERDDGRDLV